MLKRVPLTAIVSAMMAVAYIMLAVLEYPAKLYGFYLLFMVPLCAVVSISSFYRFRLQQRERDAENSR